MMSILNLHTVHSVSAASQRKSSLSEVFHKTTEVTGAPGCGKTTFIQKRYSDELVLLGGLPPSYGASKRALYSFFFSVYAIVTGAINLGQVLWLVKKSATYDETLFARINALRNSMTKFGYGFFKAQAKATLVIDEGISHIPFILGLEKDEISEFIKLFHQHLEQRKIIFVEAPPQETLIKRINTRGHKRVRKANEAEAFVIRNCRIAEQYKTALLDTGLDVIFEN
jgi:hypothetical protein